VNDLKVIERAFPVEGECEDCGEAAEDCTALILDTGEEVTVCGECVQFYPDEVEDGNEEED